MMTEVEKTFDILEKYFKSKIKDNSKAGIVFDKGSPYEEKVRYKDLLVLIERLKYHTIDRNSIDRYGTCKDCLYFDPTGYTENHGRCNCPDPYSNCGKCMGIYDTCWRHISSNMNCTKCRFFKTKGKKWFCSRSGEILPWDSAKRKTCDDWRYFA